MKSVSLYFAATPWNFLNSLVFAANRKDEQSYLMYVDFPTDKKNPYLDTLEKLPDSPFNRTWCFHGKLKGAFTKWRKRRQELEQIKRIVAELKPDQVFVGSDRRIEFQCAMTEAIKHKPNVKGVYLDEGIFSYTCRKRSKTWRDRVLDSWIKRLMYPCDWRHPSAIGASNWIREGWLLMPERACPILKQKIELKQIPLPFYKSRTLTGFLDGFLALDEKSWLQKNYDLLIILPHPTALTEELKRSMKNILAVKKAQQVAIKKHPSDDSCYQWLEEFLCASETSGRNRVSVDLLPSALPLELLLPGLNFREIVSAPSTAVLTAKLLKPECKIDLTGTDELIESLLEN